MNERSGIKNHEWTQIDTNGFEFSRIVTLRRYGLVDGEESRITRLHLESSLHILSVYNRLRVIGEIRGRIQFC